MFNSRLDVAANTLLATKVGSGHADLCGESQFTPRLDISLYILLYRPTCLAALTTTGLVRLGSCRHRCVYMPALPLFVLCPVCHRFWGSLDLAHDVTSPHCASEPV